MIVKNILGGKKSEFIGNQQILTKNGVAQSKLIFTPKQDPARPIFLSVFVFVKDMCFEKCFQNEWKQKNKVNFSVQI